MAVVLEKAVRSSVFDLAYDHSNTNFNPVPETIMQGQDLPIHLGPLVPAMRCAAGYFGSYALRRKA